MPDRVTPIESYKLAFRSTPEDHVPLLYLLAADDELAAMIAFVDGAEPLPGPRESPAGRIEMTLPSSALRDVVAMLREEKPVFLRWNREAGIATLATDAEAVGEEEARALLKALFG